MKNENQFKKNLVAVGELFNKEVSPALAKMYWNALSGFTDEQVQTAFDQAICSQKFFPKPADLIESISGTSESRSMEVWAAIMDQIRKVGSCEKPGFSEEILDIISKTGGWKYLCSLSYKQLEFKYNDFKDYFISNTKQGLIKHDHQVLKQNLRIK